MYSKEDFSKYFKKVTDIELEGSVADKAKIGQYLKTCLEILDYFDNIKDPLENSIVLRDLVSKKLKSSTTSGVFIEEEVPASIDNNDITYRKRPWAISFISLLLAVVGVVKLISFIAELPIDESGFDFSNFKIYMVMIPGSALLASYYLWQMRGWGIVCFVCYQISNILLIFMEGGYFYVDSIHDLVVGLIIGMVVIIVYWRRFTPIFDF
jgi:hypothetical protein